MSQAWNKYMNMTKLFTPTKEKDLSEPMDEEEFSKPMDKKRKSYLGAKGIAFLVLAVFILQAADYIVLWISSSDSSSTNAVLANSMDAYKQVDILMFAAVIFVVGKIAFVKGTSKSKTAKLSPGAIRASYLQKQSDSGGNKKTKASKKPERRVSFNDDTVRISELRPEAAEFVPPGGARVLMVGGEGMNVYAKPFVPDNVPKVVPPRIPKTALPNGKENNAPANGHDEKPVLEKNKWVKSEEEAKMWEKPEEKPKWTPKVKDSQHQESAAPWQQPQSKWTPKVKDPQEQVSAEQPQSKWKAKVWVPEESQGLLEDPEKNLADLIDTLVGCKWICALPGLKITQEHIITRDGRNLKCSTTAGYHTKVFNVMIDRKWNMSVDRKWQPKEAKDTQGSQGATIYWGVKSKNITLDPSQISKGMLTWVKPGGTNWIWHREAM